MRTNIGAKIAGGFLMLAVAAFPLYAVDTTRTNGGYGAKGRAGGGNSGTVVSHESAPRGRSNRERTASSVPTRQPKLRCTMCDAELLDGKCPNICTKCKKMHLGKDDKCELCENQNTLAETRASIGRVEKDRDWYKTEAEKFEKENQRLVNRNEALNNEVVRLNKELSNTLTKEYFDAKIKEH